MRHFGLIKVSCLWRCPHFRGVLIERNSTVELIELKGTIQQAPCRHIIYLNVCKLYNHGPLTDHDFIVRCIQVELIARGRWMVPLMYSGIMLIQLLRNHNH